MTGFWFNRLDRRRRRYSCPFVLAIWLAATTSSNDHHERGGCSPARATATSTSSFPARLANLREPTLNNNSSSRQGGWYDGSSSDDGGEEDDEIESSSEDESLWGPPRSPLTATHAGFPRQPAAESSLMAAQRAAPAEKQREEETKTSSAEHLTPPPPSPPLQTLQKLQNMLDETDYLTSSAVRRSNAAPLSTVTTEPPPKVSASVSSVTSPPSIVTDKRTEPERPRLWTSQDRAKYKRQQLKLRRQHEGSLSSEQKQQQQPPQLSAKPWSPPPSPPIHPFSDDERDQQSDDTDDGLGYSLPNVPVYYSDAEEGESETDGSGPTVDHQALTSAAAPVPATGTLASSSRVVPPNTTYHPGNVYHAPPNPPPPPPVHPNYYVPPRLVNPPQSYPPVVPEEGVRPQHYYPPYLYPPGSFPYMYSSYGPYVQPPFHGQYGAWSPPPPGLQQQPPPFQPGSLTRPYMRLPPSSLSSSPSQFQQPSPAQGGPENSQPANATSLAKDTPSYTTPPASAMSTNLQQPQQQRLTHPTASGYLGLMVPYDALPAFVVAPENPQSLAEASSHLNLESIEKISLLLVTAALACYAGVSPRSLPLTEYNLRFYENLRLVSLAWIAPVIQFLAVLDARENDINALVNTFFVSFTVGYLLTFAAEIAITTLVRLAVFRCFEPKIFALAPAVPVPVLPWVLRDVQYRPKRITLFAADFATSCVACPIVEEYLKLRVLQWTTTLPRNFNWVTRVSAKNSKKKRTVAEAVPRNPGQKDVLNANKYVAHMLAVSLGLKLCDAGRRILLYTKRHHANKTFFAIFRGVFPIQELCGTMTALALAKRDLLGFPTPLWKMLAPAVVIHGMANYRGMKPIFKWNSATPWSEMQLYPLNFADSSTLPQLLSKGFGKFMWFVILGRVAGYCIKNYYLVNRQAVKRTTTYAGKHAAFSAELATAEVLKKQKQNLGSVPYRPTSCTRDSPGMKGEGDERENVRSQAHNAFWKTGKMGLTRLIQDAPSVWKGREQRFYRAEKETIVENLTPFYWGALVSSFLFLTFRVTGSRWFNHVREKHLRQGPAQRKSQVAKTQWKSYLERQTEQKQEAFRESLALPTDLIISFMCGCSSTVILCDVSKLQSDFAQAPLVPGKSLIYTHMCKDMTDSYNRLDPRAFRDTDDSVLLTFQSFVRNCQLRAAFIADREAKGERLPDRVPFPGLSGEAR